MSGYVVTISIPLNLISVLVRVRTLNFGDRVRVFTQIQENAAGRRAVASAWVRGLGFAQGLQA
jgi:hypothetical protein